MENKYFTPSIEDIRVGYEMEAKVYGESPDAEERYIKIIVSSPNWAGIICNRNGDEYSLPADVYRVPYLTKEQIEGEGWKQFDLSKDFAYRMGVPDFRSGFTKGNYFVVLDTRKYHIEMRALDVLKIDFLPEFPETFRVTIPCKDINTFRYICKLLNI